MDNYSAIENDTGWSAEAGLIADTFETAILLIRSTVDSEEGKKLLQKLTTIMQDASENAAPSKILRIHIEKLAEEAVKSKERREVMLSIKAARSFSERTKVEKDESFAKRIVLPKEWKAIELLRSKNHTYKNIADHLNIQYKNQIKATGSAPFSATDIYRFVQKKSEAL